MIQRLRTTIARFRAHPVRGVVGICLVLFSVLYVAVPHPAFAQSASSAVENAIVQILGHILGFFTYVFGQILIKFIDILVTVAQFNNFIDAPAVKTGWAITRDMANMFFIVGLLVMAIGTVFRVQEYRYNRLLQKLIIMAILINFSKSIAGFFIDLSQVVMLTFVNAFKGMAAGNLASGFGIENILSLSSNASAAGGDISFLSVVGALFAAVIMVFIATVVVGIFVVVLLQRIIMLWIYIVLAPTAYMVAILPGSLGSWWNSWWRDFSAYLVKGPVIAFFLWLALTVISLSNTALIEDTGAVRESTNPLGVTDSTTIDPNSAAAFASDATTAASIINYFVAVGMLIAGLQQAMKVGGAAGAVAGKWMGNFNKWGSSIARSPATFGKYALKRPAYDAAGAVLGGASKIPLVGTTFGKLNARLTRQRQKSEEKDTDWINYADENTRKRLATSRVALTENARRDQKAARESAIKNNQFRGYSADEKQHVINSYRGDIGHQMRWDATKGEYYETASDGPGHKILRDHLTKKSPISMMPDLRAAIASGDADLERYWREQIEKSINKMTPTDFNDMDTAGWKDATNADFRHIVFGQLVPRSNVDFAKRMRSTVNAANLNDINEAYAMNAGLPAGSVLFRRGTGGAANAQDAQRRMQRADDRMRQVHNISGLRDFVSGKNNAFGLGSDLLKTFNIQGMKGGFISDPTAKRKVAAMLQGALEQDVAAIEANLADLDIEAKELQQPSKLVDASGRPLSQADVTGRASEITQEREALQKELSLKKEAAAKLNDQQTLDNVTFYNRDQHTSLGDAKTSITHEGVHASLQELDPDKKLRQEWLRAMDPADRVKMRDEVAKHTENEFISTDEAFEEYLAEGLTNQGRYGSKDPNAIQLKPEILMAVRRAAEAKGVQFKYVGMSQATTPTPESVPSRTPSKREQKLEQDFAAKRSQAGTIEARYRVERDEAMSTYDAAAEAAQQEAQTAEAHLDTLPQSQYVAAQQASIQKLQQQAADVQTGPQGRGLPQRERERLAKQYQASAASQQQALDQWVTNQSMQDPAYAEALGRVQETQAARDRAQAAKAAFDALPLEERLAQAKQRNPEIERLEKEMQKSRAKSEQAEAKVTAERRAQYVPPQPAAPAPAPAAKPQPAPRPVLRPRPAIAVSPRVAQSTEQASGGVANVSSAENPTIIQNVTQNIQQVFKGASDTVRGQLSAIDGPYIDNAFRKSYMWKGLLSLVKENIGELQRSEKLSDLGRAELTKRIGKLDKHVQDENLDGFKQEFGELKNMFGAGSTEE